MLAKAKKRRQPNSLAHYRINRTVNTIQRNTACSMKSHNSKAVCGRVLYTIMQGTPVIHMSKIGHPVLHNLCSAIFFDLPCNTVRAFNGQGEGTTQQEHCRVYATERDKHAAPGRAFSSDTIPCVPLVVIDHQTVFCWLRHRRFVMISSSPRSVERTRSLTAQGAGMRPKGQAGGSVFRRLRVSAPEIFRDRRSLDLCSRV